MYFWLASKPYRFVHRLEFASGAASNCCDTPASYCNSSAGFQLETRVAFRASQMESNQTEGCGKLKFVATKSANDLKSEAQIRRPIPLSLWLDRSVAATNTTSETAHFTLRKTDELMNQLHA